MSSRANTCRGAFMPVLAATCCGMLAVGQAPLSDDTASSLLAVAPNEAISRSHTVANSLVQTVTIGEAISRSNTVENRTIRTVEILEAVSRSQTVANAIGDDNLVFREAISRPHTVENRTIREAVIQEAISRSTTVRNNVVPSRVFSEAISRSLTVNNRTVRKVTFTEAISRSTTVLNRPELSLKLEAEAGNSTIYARCGETIRYRVVGTMSEENNQGLALVGFDLRFDGGNLPALDTPTGEPSCDNPMVNFVAPAGMTALSGFGGVPVAAQGPLCGRPGGVPAGLLHAGGAQNTFNHVGANLNGVLLGGVAQPGGCGTAVIAEGTLIAPNALGEYHVSIENAVANAVAKDATGNPIWRTRPAVVNASSQLLVNVVACDPPGEIDTFLLTECLLGPDLVPAPSGPFVDTAGCLGAFDEDNDKDVDLRDFAIIQNDFQPSECLQQRIVTSSSPPECAIDARQPTSPNGLNPSGFESITLILGCPAGDLTPASFTVSATPGGPVPTILSITPSGREVTLELSGPVSPGRWTCFMHIDSNTKACIGFLPGDVDNNRTVDFADMTTLESLLVAPSVPINRCDIDRNGVCEEADLDRLEALFFGDGAFDFWLGRSLPDCPSRP